MYPQRLRARRGAKFLKVDIPGLRVEGSVFLSILLRVHRPKVPVVEARQQLSPIAQVECPKWQTMVEDEARSIIWPGPSIGDKLRGNVRDERRPVAADQLLDSGNVRNPKVPQPRSRVALKIVPDPKRGIGLEVSSSPSPGIPVVSLSVSFSPASLRFPRPPPADFQIVGVKFTASLASLFFAPGHSWGEVSYTQGVACRTGLKLRIERPRRSHLKKTRNALTVQHTHCRTDLRLEAFFRQSSLLGFDPSVVDFLEERWISFLEFLDAHTGMAFVQFVEKDLS
jgi:hypothetical protein